MATDGAANGSSNAGDGLSAAERLMRQHAAEEAESHKPTVEVRETLQTRAGVTLVSNARENRH